MGQLKKRKGSVKTEMKPKMKSPTTAFSATLLALTSISSLLMQQFHLGTPMLAITWFLGNAVTAMLCAAVNGVSKPTKEVKQAYDLANILCWGSGMPILTAFFLGQSGLYIPCLVFLVISGAMATLILRSDLLPSLERSHAADLVAAWSSITAIGTCYFANNLTGMIGGVCMVFGNVALAQGRNFGDLTPFDSFLLTFTLANYFYGYATVHDN